jgi:hypothetical protein
MCVPSSFPYHSTYAAPFIPTLLLLTPLSITATFAWRSRENRGACFREIENIWLIRNFWASYPSALINPSQWFMQSHNKINLLNKDIFGIFGPGTFSLKVTCEFAWSHLPYNLLLWKGDEGPLLHVTFEQRWQWE